MEAHAAGDVTVLLHQIRAGDSGAADKLIPLVIEELRRLARLQLRNERPGHTLQPTALVNEAYLRLVSDQARDWRSRAHFIGVSVSVMRRILIDHAPQTGAQARGKGTDRSRSRGLRRVFLQAGRRADCVGHGARLFERAATRLAKQRTA